MARIELSNIGGGGGGSTTLALTTTGTSGTSVLTTVPGGYSLNIPVYQGALSLSTAGTSGASTLVGDTLTIPTYQGQISLTTTGTSGASTFAADTLNIPQYQGALTLTTTGTSGAATLVGTTLNIPQYSGGGGTPAGNAGEVQFNSTPAGSFAASTAFVFDTAGPYLKVGAAAPSATVGVNGAGTTSATTSLHVRNSSSVDLLKVNDNGQFLLGENGAALTTNRSASIEVSSTNTNVGISIVPKGTGAITAQIPDGTTTGGNARGSNAVEFQTRNIAGRIASGNNSVIAGGFNNFASASLSAVLGGSINLATGTNSCIGGGTQNTATATNSVVSGGNNHRADGTSSTVSGGAACQATADYSTVSGGRENYAVAESSYSPGGYRSRAYLYGAMSTASGRFGTSGQGDAQTSVFRLWRSITGTTTSELTLTAGAPAAATRAILELPTGATNGRLWNAIVQMSAICQTAGGTVTVGEAFIGTYNLGIKRIGATTSLVGTVQDMITAQADTNMSSSVVTITADDANESLKIEFTPPTGANASTVIRVVATVYLTEVGY